MKSIIEKNQRYALSILDRINTSKSMPKENKDGALVWFNFMKAKGSAVGTVSKHMFCFEIFLSNLPKGTELSKATREELTIAVGRVEDSGYASETKNNIRVVIKSFYKHYLGEDLYYPKQIAWIKTTMRKKTVLPKDILNEAEVLRMVSSASTIRDKALIALLYDAGIRVGELVGMRIKDVDLNSELAHINVDGKTGQRRIPILFSAPYLAAYIETLKDKKQDNYLWTGVGMWSNVNHKIEESGVRKILRISAKKAGIEKRIYPHLFRHSRATYYANRLTEQQLKMFFGWTGDSKMVNTYVHMSGRDIDDAVLMASGKKPREAEAPMLTEKICPRCRFANGMDFLHCQQCGAPLDPRTLMESSEAEKVMKEFIIASVKDPGAIKVLQDYLKKKK